MFIYFVSMINRSILYVVSKRCDIVGLEYLPVIILYFFNAFFYFKSELSFTVDILLSKQLLVCITCYKNYCYKQCLFSFFMWNVLQTFPSWSPYLNMMTKEVQIKHNKMKCLPYHKARTKLYCKIRKVITMFAWFFFIWNVCW